MQSVPTDSLEEDGNGINSCASEPQLKRRKLGNWLNTKIYSLQEAPAIISPQQRIMTEISQHEDSPEADPDSNQFEWWKNTYIRRQNKVPIVYRLTTDL